MKYQLLFSGKNKKNISIYCLLKILPRVLSVKLAASKAEFIALVKALFSIQKY